MSCFRGFAACACLLVSSMTFAAEGGDEERGAPIADEFSHLHPLAQAVARAGAPACAAKVTEAAFFLTEGTETTAFWNFRSTALLSFSLELVLSQGLTSYVSLNVAPGENGACVIGYDAVLHWANDCATVAEHGYPGMRRIGRQPEKMAMLTGPDAEHVFLMPVDQGCVAIRKEVFP